MKRKLLVAIVSLLCFLMVGSVFATALSLAGKSLSQSNGRYHLDLLTEEKTFNTTVPNAIYDFSTADMVGELYEPHDISYSFNAEGNYTTFTALKNDPYVQLKAPACKPQEAQWISVTYRTNHSVRSEFFNTRTETGVWGSSGTNFQWELTGNGEWVTDTAHCNAWMNAPANSEFKEFRFDPLESYNGIAVTAGNTLDIQCIAFFSTEDDAKGFNLGEYKAKLVYDANHKDENDDNASKVEWPDPTFTPVDSVEMDMNIGTMKYTPSEDGKTMTISYEVNGETVSYTVPNNENYISGGYAALDDLNRPLYDSSEVGSYKADDRYVGLFYFLWHGEHGDTGVFDLQKIIDEYGIQYGGKVSSGLYPDRGQMAWFAEPLYGYYYANDEWVLRKHAELLTNANIDFLYFDVTNAYTYTPNALKLMKILHELNEQGYDAPQVVFYTHSSADTTVRNLYNTIYKPGRYEDTWFCIDGKPVIISPENISLGDGKKVTDFFTVKREQWPNDPNYNENAWPWMDFEWPQRIFTDKEGKPSAVSVSIAQHSGTVCFSHSSLYNNYTNRGRSFTNPHGFPSTDSKFDRALHSSYDNWKANPDLTMYGLNFQAQWDYAIKSEAEFILVTGWNEWVAQRQEGGDQVIFIDTASMEFSRDAEMMRGGYFDNYYIQLIYNVQKLKGTAPVIVQDSRKPINVTGNFDQWSDVVVTYKDSIGDTMDRNNLGFGKQTYTNTSGRNDIVASKVTSDTKNLYFYVKTDKDITMFDTKSSWMQIYVNSDADGKTGWYGYDYIVNYQAKDTFTTTVAKYTGADNKYAFEPVGEIAYRVKGNEMMLAVPQELLGIKGYLEIDIEFKIADSKTVYDEMEDFYCDGDAAPLGRLNYVYQNYIPGVSNVTYPEIPEETTPSIEETTPAPEPSESETESAPVVENPGCSSVLGSAAVVAIVTLAGALALCKKKD